jgi:hypothetical protein
MDKRSLSQEMIRMAAPVRGILRQLDRRELLGIPRILEMWVWIAIEVLKKKSCELSRFREVPEASTKSMRMVLRLLAS